jgi:phenylpyruvate tautomerase PptA (4-oxalocrotonate tautomerase family)
MPIVHVYMWSGLSKEAKARIVNITRVYGGLGIPAHAVEVIIHETPRENWAARWRISK